MIDMERLPVALPCAILVDALACGCGTCRLDVGVGDDDDSTKDVRDIKFSKIIMTQITRNISNITCQLARVLFRSVSN